MLQCRVVLHPLNPNVLYKFGIELSWSWAFISFAALSPIQDELWNSLIDEIVVDFAAIENLSGIGTGSPSGIEGCRFLYSERLGLFLLLAAPVDHHMLAKFVLPGVTRFTAFAPIKDEIFQLVQGKLPGYAVI